MEGCDEFLKASQVSQSLQVGRNFPYTNLRHLAKNVGIGSKRRPVLRWRRSDVLGLLDAPLVQTPRNGVAEARRNGYGPNGAKGGAAWLVEE